MDNFDLRKYLAEGKLHTLNTLKKQDSKIKVEGKMGNESNLLSTKMKVSELKAKIKQDILAELSLKEDEDEDVNDDMDDSATDRDEVDIDIEADDIEIERKDTEIKSEVGLSPEEELIQDSLKAAMDAANSLGNQKLADQIGNTITFFTREFVVGNR
jgi:hypothetical protein